MPCPTLPALTASRLEWAQFYAAVMGWPVFPCNGKVPFAGSHGWQDATRDPAHIEAWWTQYPHANIACPTNGPWWVLDVDPRNDGATTLFNLVQQYGPLPDTLLSHTGGGGNHYLLLTPPEGIRHKAQIGEGLDVLATGGYIILPPSIHPDTGMHYVWDIAGCGPDDIDPQPAPDWLLHLIGKAQAPQAPLPAGAPILNGTRDDTLARMVIRMCRAGLGITAIRAAIEIENQRCQPPMTNEELDRLVQARGQYTPEPVFQIAPPVTASTSAPPGWGLPGGAPVAPPAPPDWRTHLFMKKSGGLVQDVRNISLILEHHEYWRGQFWWDEVGSRPMLGDQRIDEDTIVGIARWLGTEEQLSVTNLRMVERCVFSRCRALRYDVLQAWLKSLPPWDQVPRITHWLSDIAGVEPTVYGQEVSRLLLLSMVARAMDPGCICRYVVILEGPEEWGKSTLVQELASEKWYVVLSVGLDTKDSHMMLQGAWLAEMAELDSLSRTEETRLKAFITMRQDSYIPKYSNFRESHLRRAIFIGTTNEESYLKGQTGNTRFLPVKITQPVDIEGLRAIRPQLFAEALAVYHGDPLWWKLSPEATEQARDEREQRRLVNVYESPLQAWLEHDRFQTPLYVNNTPVVFTANETSWPEIAQHFLGLKTAAEWKDMNLQKQIASALKTQGWHPAVVFRNGLTTRLWLKG